MSMVVCVFLQFMPRTALFLLQFSSFRCYRLKNCQITPDRTEKKEKKNCETQKNGSKTELLNKERKNGVKKDM